MANIITQPSQSSAWIPPELNDLIAELGKTANECRIKGQRLTTFHATPYDQGIDFRIGTIYRTVQGMLKRQTPLPNIATYLRDEIKAFTPFCDGEIARYLSFKKEADSNSEKLREQAERIDRMPLTAKKFSPPPADTVQRVILTPSISAAATTGGVIGLSTGVNQHELIHRALVEIAEKKEWKAGTWNTSTKVFPNVQALRKAEEKTLLVAERSLAKKIAVGATIGATAGTVAGAAIGTAVTLVAEGLDATKAW